LEQAVTTKLNSGTSTAGSVIAALTAYVPADKVSAGMVKVAVEAELF